MSVLILLIGAALGVVVGVLGEQIRSADQNVDPYEDDDPQQYMGR